MRHPLWLGAGLFPLIVVLSGLSVWVLGSDARREIDKLAIANSDNSQWSLAQSEVEFLTMHTATLEAVSNPNEETLERVRNRFNIFYSRMQTIKSAPYINGVASTSGVSEAIDAVSAFLERYVPAIDADDQTLAAALPEISAELSPLRLNVRTISLAGVRWFPHRSDLQRQTVSGALQDLGLIAFLLLAVLLAVVAVLMMLMRASQRQAAEIAVTQNRLQAVVSTSLDGVLVVDQDGIVLDYNGAAEGIFGYTRAEAIGAHMSELIIPDYIRDVHDAAVTRHRRTGERHVIGAGLMRMEAKHKDGSTFPIEFSVNSARSEEGEIFVSFLRDISSRVANETELVEARDRAVAGEKAKADLLAVMSHEMRTPLNGVLGTLDLLSDTDLNDRQRQYVDVMETSGRMLLEHVNNVLDISRIDAGKAKVGQDRFDVVKLVSEVVDSLAGQARLRGNRLAVEALTNVGTVMGDEPRLRQILFNLLGNAIKFTENGRVSVEIEGDPDSDWVEFRIIDTGIGIVEEDLDRIFSDFVTLDTSYQREVEGTGLGLGIVRRLVTLLHGEMGAESEPGDGSVFWFRLKLPAHEGALARGAGQAADAPVFSDGGCKVLVVEDNEINRMVAREMLLQQGCDVVEASDGQDGVDHALVERFDLILMDISMPKMDGTVATRRIRQHPGPNQATPIMALTAHALPDDIQRFRSAGMSEVLTKPLSRQRLVDVLNGLAVASALGNGGDEGSPVSDLIQTMGAERAGDLKAKARGELSDGLRTLRDMLDSGQAGEDVAAFAHKLAGTAGLMGMSDLHAAFIAVEMSAHASVPTGIDPLLGAVEREIARLS